LEITSDREFAGLHHYDIVAIALKEFERELHDNPTREHVLKLLRAELKSRGPGSA
jgi:hypothetical protein